LALDARTIFSLPPATIGGHVILNANDGKIITTLPIEAGTDGAEFNPNTMKRIVRRATGR